jgi:SNF2 family DNA or RNA helicase
MGIILFLFSIPDEMGLGKTVQVVSFLSYIIKGSFTTSPALVLAPKSILLQWKKVYITFHVLLPYYSECCSK